jgi:hypothetical protein
MSTKSTEKREVICFDDSGDMRRYMTREMIEKERRHRESPERTESLKRAVFHIGVQCLRAVEKLDSLMDHVKADHLQGIMNSVMKDCMFFDSADACDFTCLYLGQIEPEEAEALKYVTEAQKDNDAAGIPGDGSYKFLFRK